MFESKLVKSCFGDTHQRPIRVRKSRDESSLTRFFVHAALVLLTGLFSVSAHAYISCKNGSGVQQTLIAGSLSVGANAAPGTTVGTLAPITYTMQCMFVNDTPYNTSDSSRVVFGTNAARVYGADVYATGIEGLGVRYIFNSSACNATNVTMTKGTKYNGEASVSCPFSGPLGGPYQQAAITVTAQLVVTGAIKAGASQLTAAPSVTIDFYSSNGGPWGQPSLYTGAATGTLTGVTCSVNNSQIPIALPDVKVSDFSSGVGSVAGPKEGVLSLTCQSGVKVWITLTDNVQPSNRTNTLQLTGDSTAKGIGIQVLNPTGSPVLFGADSAASGNQNQWLIGDSPNGTLPVPLTAQYIRTGTVSGGSVKALATFTMSYQ
ncbi:fimbrial protein [Paraburkholderia nemoris]|jgi:P pilus assembly protein, pilin FimA|uniref:fimbrial protein n=1 Tax=Paraburkholderia nemoris TaxID=2793076 RepID=UPI001B8AD171|nr:fimbrial protein [Paraburkholderia nemoris]